MMRPMERATHGGTAGRPPVPGVTAREIAEGTGLSLSSVYRNLHLLEARGIIVRTQSSQESPERSRMNV